MKRILLYVGAGLLTFLGFIVVFAPASLLYNPAAAELGKTIPELRLLSMSKTIWNGRAQLRYRHFPDSEISWELAVFPLLMAHGAVQVSIDGDGHKLHAHLDLDNVSMLIKELEGTITSSFVNQESQNLGIKFTGELQLQNINLSANRHWLTSVDGNLHWTGGKIHVEPRAAGGAPGQIFELPALDGALSLDDNVLVLDVIYQGAKLVLVRLKPDGWAEVSVKARLFDIANVPWPAGSSLDETVIQLEEQLFQGKG